MRSAFGRRLGQLTFFSFLIKYLTLGKVINFFRINSEYRKKKLIIKGKPLFAFIDPGNICNLRCPHCPTGRRQQGREVKIMTLENYKNFFDQLKSSLIVVGVYNWGEPLLNKDIFQMINYSHQNKVGTVISSNFNIIAAEDIDRLIHSGLDVLTVSLDGATAESYSKYRQGGDFAQVLKNIELLLLRRRELGKKNPKVRWQFIVNRFNEGEIELAKKLARKIGVDQITFDTRFKLIDHMSGFKCDEAEATKWLPSDKKYLLDPLYTFTDHCGSLWKTVIINHDGGVAPCTSADDKATDFGNLFSEEFEDIWNNKYYQNARSLFSPVSLSVEHTVTLCQKCRLYKKVDRDGYKSQ